MHSILDLSEIDTKIGRLFMAGMPGTRVDSGTEALIRDYGLGGVILFGRNIHNPVQLATLCNDLQGMAMKYHGIPLLLSIDQEGGPVARLKEPFTSFPGNSAIGLDPRPMDKAMEFFSKEFTALSGISQIDGFTKYKIRKATCFATEGKSLRIFIQTKFNRSRIVIITKNTQQLIYLKYYRVIMFIIQAQNNFYIVTTTSKI